MYTSFRSYQFFYRADKIVLPYTIKDQGGSLDLYVGLTNVVDESEGLGLTLLIEMDSCLIRQSLYTGSLWVGNIYGMQYKRLYTCYVEPNLLKSIHEMDLDEYGYQLHNLYQKRVDKEIFVLTFGNILLFFLPWQEVGAMSDCSLALAATQRLVSYSGLI